MSPVNDATSESSGDSASSDGSSSEGEDARHEPPPEVEVKNEPETNKWNLSAFLPGVSQKSPTEAPLSHEPPEAVKPEEHDDEEDGEIQRTPSDHYQNENSNSSMGDKSDGSPVHESMPPPAKVTNMSAPPDKTPDADINLVLKFINGLQNLQPISSISDSEDNVEATISGNERPKKKRSKKVRLRPEVDGAHSSSDESSRFSESRTDEKKPRGRPKTSTSSDNKSPRKESRKSASRRLKSRETVPSTDDSSDDEKPPKPSPAKVKESKKPSKKKPESPIASSSDSEPAKHSPLPYQSPPSSDHSDSDASSRSSAGAKQKKIEIVSDKNKQATLHKLFNVTKTSEGGKGGKGGAKGKGQVVVITPDDTQSQVKVIETVSVQNSKYLSPSSAFNSVIVRIDLSRIDLSRLQIPAEKLKNTVIRTKSPAVALEAPRKSKKRRRSENHDEQDRWRTHPSSIKNFDQLSVSSSSSTSSDQHPATRTSHNTTDDRLNNNNIDHKTKDMNSFYYSPSSVDAKLSSIKRESSSYNNVGKPQTNDFKNKIKQEVKQEDFDGVQDMRKRASSLNNNSHTFKERKRKRPDGGNDNSLPMPPTNHERVSNGDLMPKLEVRKVYMSYFEARNSDVEQPETAK